MLLELGQLDAAIEHLRAGVDLPDPFGRRTERQTALMELYRDRALLHRDIGDAQLRLGRPGAAREAYRSAFELPGGRDAEMLARLVHACRRDGDPQAAVDAVVSAIAWQRGLLSPDSIALLEHLGDGADTRPHLDAALANIAEGNAAAGASSAIALARAAVADPGRAVEILQAQVLADPSDRAALIELHVRLRELPVADARATSAALLAATPRREAELTGLLLDALGAVDDVPPLAGPPSAAAGVVQARLLTRAGRIDEAMDLLDELAAAHPEDVAVLLARCALLDRRGRGGEADAAMDGFRPAAEDFATRHARAIALGERGRLRDALAELDPVLVDAADDPLGVEALLLAARLELELGRPAVAETRCRRALAIDPDDEAAHFLLIGLYSPSSELANPTRLVQTIRSLRERAPWSRSLTWLRASEATGRGQLDLAERTLLELLERPHADDRAELLLAQLWGQARSVERAEAWLRARVDSRPDDDLAPVLLAKVLLAARQVTEAEEVLTTALERWPGDRAVSIELERLVREVRRQPERAQVLALRRLAFAPPTGETRRDRARLELVRLDLEAVLVLLEELVAEQPHLEPAQSAGLEALLVGVAEQAMTRARYVPIARRIFEVAFPHLAGPAAGTSQLRVRIAARDDGLAIGRLEQIATEASARHPELREAAFLLAAEERVMRAVRRRITPLETKLDAIGMLERATRRLGDDALQVHAAWLRFAWDVAITHDDTDPVTGAVALGVQRETLRDVLAELVPLVDFGDLEPGFDPVAELAYELASAHVRAQQLTGDPEESGRAAVLYELALEIQPDHPRVGNDYGYMLLEEDEQIPRAVRLIEIAYAADSSDVNFIDSLGWARYKQGRFLDEVDPETGERVAGAITVLRRADRLAAAEDGVSPFTRAAICEHLGDALWRSGNREAAIEAWEEAIGHLLPLSRAAPRPGQAVVRRNATEGVERAQERVRAAREDREPELPTVHAPATALPGPDIVTPRRGGDADG